MAVLTSSRAAFSGEIDVLFVGGGGCGLTAALAAREAGADVVVIERDRGALGSMATSTGLTPATTFGRLSGAATAHTVRGR